MSIHNERSFIINHLIRHDFHARAGVSLSFQFFHYIKKKKKKKKKRHAKSLRGWIPSIHSINKIKKKTKNEMFNWEKNNELYTFLVVVVVV